MLSTNRKKLKLFTIEQTERVLKNQKEARLPRAKEDRCIAYNNRYRPY